MFEGDGRSRVAFACGVGVDAGPVPGGREGGVAVAVGVAADGVVT